MRKIVLITGLLLFSILMEAQVVFYTAITQQPIIEGASFQVQFIIEDADLTDDFKAPSFENFRVVSGPNIYTGSMPSFNGQKRIRNIIYTLEAKRPGNYIIKAASITANGKTIYSNKVTLTVISEKQAIRYSSQEKKFSSSNYFLRLGEDPYEKIRNNLFLKVQVDKKSCFPGEPVVATFKLYSSLESKSDIIKNPGFYGFTVFDMINLSDKEVVAEKINGKLFDVHTIRKVQLYPLQAGSFTIDPMEVKNKVEFSRSVVYKKTEQEIAEGMFGNDDEPEKSDAVYFESEISTEPVAINVKPLPENSNPIDFNGAVGRFIVSASLVKNILAKNEEGILEITINGTGNFIQLTAPTVNWPSGIDFFEPSISDFLNKRSIPLSGSRIFHYPFVSTKEGEVEIPAVFFNFYDTDSNKYRSLSTSPIKLTVTKEKMITPLKVKKKTSINAINRSSSRIAGLIVIGVVLIVLIYWLRRGKETTPEIVKETEDAPDPDDILRSATESIDASANEFYHQLYQSLWKFMAEKLKLDSSLVNKSQLINQAQQKGIPEDITDKLERIFSECEAGQFTNASLEEERQSLLMIAKEIITTSEKYLL